MTYHEGYSKEESQGDFKTALYGTGLYGRDYYSDLDISLLSPVLWFDAKDISTITKDGSQKVSQWDDKSGLSQDATQGAGAQQPTYVENALNGQPTISFSAASNTELAGTFDSTFSNETFTFFSVSLGALGSAGVIWGASTTSSFERFEMTYFLGTTKLVNFIGDGSSRDFPDFFVPIVDDAAGHAIFVERNSTDVNGLKGSIDNGAITEGTATKITTDTGFLIGGRAGAGFHLNGSVGEIIVFDRLLSSFDKTAIQNYLSKRWIL